ncbi:MAG: hypothetical protein QOG62_2146 [Thermoleophilaceae bacterium]|jgi:predicted O-methyltransferase YrrM|nr:hypothetical protein [Thermoleophilaceae bacterium]
MSGSSRLRRATDRIREVVRPPPVNPASVDLVLAELLRAADVASLKDPVAYVEVLRGCFEPLRFTVKEIGDSRAAGSPGGGVAGDVLFRTLLNHLGSGVFPTPAETAVRVACVADELLADREPFDRPDWAGDVGLHALAASSFGRKGRMLAAAARIMRTTQAIELGTGYGMASVFLSSALGPDNGVVTVEISWPQVDVARRVLAEAGCDNVQLIAGAASGTVEEVKAVVSQADLMFHDAEHSAAAYVDDFAAFEPVLAPGALVIYDDIAWSNPRTPSSDLPYEGWLKVASHARVRRAVELDGEFGMLLLS